MNGLLWVPRHVLVALHRVSFDVGRLSGQSYPNWALLDHFSPCHGLPSLLAGFTRGSRVGLKRPSAVHLEGCALHKHSGPVQHAGLKTLGLGSFSSCVFTAAPFCCSHLPLPLPQDGGYSRLFLVTHPEIDLVDPLSSLPPICHRT